MASSSSPLLSLLLLFSLELSLRASATIASPSPRVIIIGAGMSGIMAAKKLSENGVDDFLILEGSDRIGGRLHKTSFAGKSVELGANWIEGVGGEHMNPIWELAIESNLRTFLSDYSNVTYNFYNFDGTHAAQSEVWKAHELERASANFSWHLAATLRENDEEDISIAASQRLFGYVPETPLEMAMDYMAYDAEIAGPKPSTLLSFLEPNLLTFLKHNWLYCPLLTIEPPRVTSLKNVEPIPTKYYFGEDEQFVADERGYEFLIHRLAGEFLDSRNGFIVDSRLHLNKVVWEISYTPKGADIVVEDGTTYKADYVIVSVSLGVLQSKLIGFKPKLPRWKLLSIFKFDMVIFTKIFLKFPYKFWPSGPGTEFFVYASERRGYFTMWQHLGNQYPGSNILIATVTDDESRRIEHQSDDRTKAEAVEVLRRMFGSDVPDAQEILVPRWGQDRFSRGSYSNWPIGVTEEDFDELKAPVGPIYFTGEHTSRKFNGYVHGAYFAGQETASLLLESMKYKTLKGKYMRKNLI